MDKFAISDITESNILDVAKMAVSALNLGRYCNSYEETLNFALGYIYLELSEVNFTKALVKDDIIVGLVAGRIENEPLLFDKDLFLKKAEYFYKLAFGEFSKDGNLYTKTCQKLFDETNVSYDGELSLLILEENCRGKHFGSKLVKLFLDYARLKHKENIYVFTDTDCNYKFYENIGFKQKGNYDISFKYPNHQEDLTCFIYDVNI